MIETGEMVLPSPEAVSETLAARCAEVENLVRRCYSIIESRLPAGIALLTVGGFGRRELFPHSDVDLLLLAESEDRIPALREALSVFLQSLWDAGLRPSHSVRTVSECATEHEGNVELTLSLLDRRFLAGDRTLSGTLDARFSAFLAKRGQIVARWLGRLIEVRHAKYQNTMYHLEPNLKETPGALRDLHAVRWLAQLRQEQPEDLSAPFALLAALRVRLHEAAGRDQNVLSFDMQEALSSHPAALMRDYYRQARGVARSLARALESPPPPATLLGGFHDWRARLSTSAFTVARDRVHLRDPRRIPPDLSLFEFVSRHQLRLASTTVDSLEGFVPQAGWEIWKELLSLPRPSFGLRAMQEAGTLAAALPEWTEIECLVVRDFYHRYTVDEHTLVAIESLESIADARFSALWEETSDPFLVRFALLMHDIGKGSGNEHVGESMRVARGVLERLRTPGPDSDAVEFLVGHHLDLSAVMTSRDLHDGTTARMLAENLGTIERLKQLAMMTYADISAVNPQAMTAWRLEQLWRVYMLAHEELTRELYADRIHDAVDTFADRAAFLEGLPTRYLRTHTPAEIDRHFESARQLKRPGVSIGIEHERDIYRLTLLTHDRPALFASVAGAISSFGLDILKAEAFSNSQGVVVDTFSFSDPYRTLELNPSEVERLRDIVGSVAKGTKSVEDLLRGRPRVVRRAHATRIKPAVTFNHEASETATLIEIVAEDRPGLLYDLARTLSASGCSIDVVLVDTEAHKALDVFYVTRGGRKLDDDLEVRLKNELLAACIPS